MFSDFDDDGLPDLVVTGYTDLSALPLKSTFVFPNDFSGISSRLYRNNGDGTFTDVTTSVDLAWNTGRARNAITADFNHDGKPDIALWSTLANRIMLNNGSARFTPVESLPFIASSPDPFGFHGTVADLNGDGFDDLLILDEKGNWRLLLNRAELFEEAPFTVLSEQVRRFPANFESVTAVRLKSDTNPYLLALQRDGQIAVFEKQKT
jgi:hypothetical protein